MRGLFTQWRLFVLRLTALVAAAFLLSSCSSPTGRLVGPGGAPPPQAVLVISDAGISNLTPETRYGPKSIGEAMPGFEIETIQTAGETGTQWTYAAFLDGLQIAQIFKGENGKIGVVHGVGDAVAGPNGERLGMTFAQSGLSRRSCRVGTKLWRGMAICDARNSEKIKLVFAIAEFDGPFDRLAPSSELDRATLQRILWVP
ncbi:Protein of unknown function [Cohaesibacter sp. ES.047]|uniref:DUF1131 family protein n=1 Tax=Cohaesibacter sp. ES.047 TaxID=1798205 RepID=UPI000BBFDFFF|nr:DUF1131 family protein [Cohaesibacter sp. ES.047]SNY92744.1 Protein of unknown function [Cohaesibacter sp. ES.047]